MIHRVRPFDRRQFVIPALILGALAVFATGRWSSRRGEASAADEHRPANHEVSSKTWPSSKEIRDRFGPEEHRAFMLKAIANSRLAGVEKRTGGAFGSVVVDRSGRVVAEGSNHVVAENDPTWHGEMEAIRVACKRLKALKLDGCVLYTSAEPCPMCLATAYWAGLDGIVYGANVGDAKKYGGFDDAFIYDQFTKAAPARAIPQVQMLRDEAVEVWKRYAAQAGNVPY